MDRCSTDAHSTDHADRAEASFTGSGGGTTQRAHPASSISSSSSQLPPQPPSAPPPLPPPSAAACGGGSVPGPFVIWKEPRTSSPQICSSRRTDGATLRRPSTDAAGIAGEVYSPAPLTPPFSGLEARMRREKPCMVPVSTQ